MRRQEKPNSNNNSRTESDNLLIHTPKSMMEDMRLFVGVRLPVCVDAEPSVSTYARLATVHAQSRAVHARRAQLGLPRTWTVHPHLAVLTLRGVSFAVLAQVADGAPLDTLARIAAEWPAHRAAVCALAAVCEAEFVPRPPGAPAPSSSRPTDTDVAAHLLHDPGILLNILRHVDGLTLFAASRVCRTWHTVANSSALQHLRAFPSPELRAYAAGAASGIDF